MATPHTTISCIVVVVVAVAVLIIVVVCVLGGVVHPTIIPEEDEIYDDALPASSIPE